MSRVSFRRLALLVMFPLSSGSKLAENPVGFDCGIAFTPRDGSNELNGRTG